MQPLLLGPLTKEHFSKYLRIHNDAKSYEYIRCDKNNSRREQFVTHIRMQTGENLFLQPRKVADIVIRFSQKREILKTTF